MAFRALSHATLIQSLMWSLFIILHRRLSPCPCSALACTGSNGWPCPWFTPRPSSSSTVCLQFDSNGSAMWYCDLITSGLKGLIWKEAQGLPCPVLRATSYLALGSGQWNDFSGPLWFALMSPRDWGMTTVNSPRTPARLKPLPTDFKG